MMIEKSQLSSGALALGLVAAMVTAGCSPSGQEGEAAETNEGFVKVVNVEVEWIAPADFTTYIRLTGEIEALNDVEVSAEETGVIERFLAEKGDFVQAGAPIAKIRASVLGAMVAEAEASSKLADERFERQRQLWEDEQMGSEIAVTPFQVENGTIALPTAPGLGIDLDEAALARHPYRAFPARRLRHPGQEGP